MALTFHLSRLTLGQALDLAETMRQRAQDAGPPPGIEALTPRSRAAYDRLIDALKDQGVYVDPTAPDATHDAPVTN